nr:MAG TPA: hypothetical protein [Caudoviricetes sp.]
MLHLFCSVAPLLHHRCNSKTLIALVFQRFVTPLHLFLHLIHIYIINRIHISNFPIRIYKYYLGVTYIYYLIKMLDTLIFLVLHLWV